MVRVSVSINSDIDSSRPFRAAHFVSFSEVLLKIRFGADKMQSSFIIIQDYFHLDFSLFMQKSDKTCYALKDLVI